MFLSDVFISRLSLEHALNFLCFSDSLTLRSWQLSSCLCQLTSMLVELRFWKWGSSKTSRFLNKQRLWASKTICRRNVTDNMIIFMVESLFTIFQTILDAASKWLRSDWGNFCVTAQCSIVQWWASESPVFQVSRSAGVPCLFNPTACVGVESSNVWWIETLPSSR